MKLTDEIIEILSSKNTNLENALIKTKVLLHKLGEKELLIWVNNELNGYSEKDRVPGYRHISTRVFGNATNGYRQWKNHQLPINHLSKDIQKFLSNEIFNESISSLESLSTSKDMLMTTLAPELCPSFNPGLGHGISVETAYKQISPIQITSILTQIRSRLLDFILELSDRLPDKINDEDLKAKSKEIDTTSVFNHTIIGDNTTIIMGNNNRTSNIYKNNFDKIEEALKSQNISPSDIAELKTSIENDSDSINNKTSEYGLNVRNWVKKISMKVTDKSAIELITEILNKFYGWI